jgi:protein-tyrosine-phosphatase
MADLYLKRRLAHSGLAHVVVSSAGTLDIHDRPADSNAVKAMRELNVDLDSHRSRGLRESDLISADHVIVMERTHLEWLAQHFPEGRGRRWLIRAFEESSTPNPDAPDLDDPIGQSITLFRQQRDQICACIDHFVRYLKHEEG